MKKLFLAGVAALFLATGTAHANSENYSCDTPTPYIGENVLQITRTYIIFNYNLDIWSIQHLLLDGTSAYREAQYQIKDESNSSGQKKWTGSNRKNPNLVMMGEIKHEVGKWAYFEWLWNKGELIMNQGAYCINLGIVTDPQYPNWVFSDPPVKKKLWQRRPD
jgi:hypothetical protein